MREKLINDTLQFCSKDAMNIEGLDRDAIEELVDKGVIKTFEDVMSLHLDLVVAPGPYEKFKMSNISVIYDSIERAKKEAKPENVLYSMCIPGVTPALAKAIIKRFHRISDMLYHRFCLRSCVVLKEFPRNWRTKYSRGYVLMCRVR